MRRAFLHLSLYGDVSDGRSVHLQLQGIHDITPDQLGMEHPECCCPRDHVQADNFPAHKDERDTKTWICWQEASPK